MQISPKFNFFHLVAWKKVFWAHLTLHDFTFEQGKGLRKVGACFYAMGNPLTWNLVPSMRRAKLFCSKIENFDFIMWKNAFQGTLILEIFKFKHIWGTQKVGAGFHVMENSYNFIRWKWAPKSRRIIKFHPKVQKVDLFAWERAFQACLTIENLCFEQGKGIKNMGVCFHAMEASISMHFSP